MAPMDVTFENEQGFTTGAVDAGVKMTDVPKPAAPGSAVPKSGNAVAKADSGTPGKAVDLRWPQSAEDAQRMIDRLMASPTFRADYANQNNPERGKLVEGLTQLYKLANPEPGEEGQEQTVQDLVENLPNLERFAGIRMPDVGPGARAFDTGDYAQFVNYVVEQDIPAATAQNLMESYATRLIASGGKGLTPGDFVELRAQYASRLSLEQMNMLQAWIEAVYAQAKARAHTVAGG